MTEIDDIHFEPLHQGLGLHPRPKLLLPIKPPKPQNLIKESEPQTAKPRNIKLFIERASFLDRTQAMFLDLGLVLLLHVFFVGVLGVFVFLYKDILLSWEHLSTVKVQLVLLSFFLFMSYFVFFDCLGGQTPGKHLFHIEVSWKSDKWRFLRVMTRVLATPFFFLYMKDKSFFHDCVSRSYVRKTTLV